MFSFTPLATAALVALSYAAPTPEQAPNPITGLPVDYVWTVDNWVAGGVRAGSSYDFDVSAPDCPPGKPFSAHCSGLQPFAGSGEEVSYTDCKLNSGGSASDGFEVAAYLKPYDLNVADGVAQIYVSIQYLDLTDAQTPTTRNYTGFRNATYNQFSGPAYSFTIVPSTASAVA